MSNRPFNFQIPPLSPPPPPLRLFQQKKALKRRVCAFVRPLRIESVPKTKKVSGQKQQQGLFRPLPHKSHDSRPFASFPFGRPIGALETIDEEEDENEWSIVFTNHACCTLLMKEMKPIPAIAN
ncbi:hypothetical protein niasHT_021700 [Heterodera trifolii]|uniref:Uncharacterized protein n=1 Tax=Heterodera trifolii TaxID=157864 RepID=A0ABD2KSA4_9BILA